MTGILQQHCDIQDVAVSKDGVDAIKRIKTEDFDLVVLEWDLPEKSGVEVLEEVRAEGIKVPIIMVTAAKDKDRVIRAFHAGANDYLMKPFAPRPGAKRILNVIKKAQEPPREPSSRTALVADDSPIARKILSNTLKRVCGFGEITEVSDGQAAVDAVRDTDFDVVLLDWSMPSLSGIEALRAIRAARKSVPVIMVTMENEGARIVEAIDAGANNYIIKPFEPQSLAQKIRQVLRIRD